MKENSYPRGFLACGVNIGIKEKEILDFGVVHSEVACSAAGLFTRNNFPGHPVVVGREHVRDGILQTIIVNSGNANVATGEAGLQLVREYCRIAADNLKIAPELILPSSTGVIGRPMPEEKMKKACGSIAERLTGPDFERFARAIMTTDKTPKIFSRELKSGIRITAVAKGAGMIQPDMATMLSYVFTDALIAAPDLKRLLRCVADCTLNRVSIDSDTSTSDTFVALANGKSGVTVRFPEEAAVIFNDLDPLESELTEIAQLDAAGREFVKALVEMCDQLACLIASDGEGASKLILLKVTEARDKNQALKIGRSIINSPLFKTAVRGADPNWGRLIMAIGKVFDEPLPMEGLKLFMGDYQLTTSNPHDLNQIAEYMKNKVVRVRVSLGTGKAAETLRGCDLTEEYIKINAYYTT